MKFSSRAVLMAAVAAGALSAPAFAQERQTVDVITVTAQKREQGIQDVPVAVTAYTAELLQNSGVRDIRDLAVVAPGLNVTSTSSEYSTTARIRGVGTVGDNPGLELSVGIVIDGVPRARNGVSFGDLGEIERIEVLRGPQGTLFGANTSAGIINIVTADPEFEFGASLEATYLTDGADGYRLAGSVTGPLAEDQAAFRLYAATGDRDGFQTVQTFGGPRTEGEDNDQDFWTVRGSVLFDLNERGELIYGAISRAATKIVAARQALSLAQPPELSISSFRAGVRYRVLKIPSAGSSSPIARPLKTSRMAASSSNMSTSSRISNSRPSVRRAIMKSFPVRTPISPGRTSSTATQISIRSNLATRHSNCALKVKRTGLTGWSASSSRTKSSCAAMPFSTVLTSKRIWV